MEFAVPVHGPARAGPAAIVHIAELTAGDQPQRARPQARSTPIRPQLARVRRITGEQDGTGGCGRRRPRYRQRCRAARRGDGVTAAAAQDQGCDHGDEGNSCCPGKPAPSRQAGIACRTLADLIQPSHLLRTDPPSCNYAAGPGGWSALPAAAQFSGRTAPHRTMIRNMPGANRVPTADEERIAGSARRPR
jgi:hypothetical protein